MSEKKASMATHSQSQSRGDRKLNGARRTPSLSLPVTARTALKAMLLSPTMLLLMGLGAVSTFFCINYVSSLIRSFYIGGALSDWYAIYGANGLAPAFVVIEVLHWTLLALIPLVLFVSIPIGYGVSGTIAEDLNAMPESLLMSRPVSRWRYLLTNFLIRSMLVILVTFVVPFMLAYPSAVSAMESSYGSFITTKMSPNQWTQLAWGTPLVEALVLYSSVFLILSAFTLAFSAFWRRGAVAVPAVLVLAGVAPVITMTVTLLTGYGGASHDLFSALELVLPFRLFSGELDASYSFPNLLLASTAWWIMLLTISLALYNKVGN